LAGGRGTRLKPLTDEVPKALMPVEGKPLIEQLIRDLSDAGISSYTTVVGWLGGQIRDYLDSINDGRWQIQYVNQKKQLGSAHALKQIKAPEADYLVSACDCLYPVSHLKKMLSYHAEGSHDITLSLKQLPPDKITESSTVLYEDGWVEKIIEKPTLNELLSNIACNPLYILPPQSMKYINETDKSIRGEYEITSALQAMLEQGYKTKGVLTDDWVHLTTPADFLRLNFPYLKKMLDEMI